MLVCFSKQQETIEKPINNSKGCDGIVRVAPAGFSLAGTLAYLIADIIAGAYLGPAVSDTFIELSKHENNEEDYEALREAVDLPCSNAEPLEAIKRLGEGWVGEEALAISVYCALKYCYYFKTELTVAVNHDGDSDSIRSITGTILGAYLGIRCILKGCIEKVGLKNEICQIADDLLCRYQEGRDWWNKYPGY